MTGLRDAYHRWRRHVFPASKEDVAWRHELLDARLDALLTRIQQRETSIVSSVDRFESEFDAGGYSVLDLKRAHTERRLIILDYPLHPKKREYERSAAGKKISAMLERNADSYTEALGKIAGFKEEFSRISVSGEVSSLEPYWDNDWIPGLDSAYLYTLIRTSNPAIYLEVGSGNSTKFVRRAIKDGSLRTKIISIDPHPRAEIDRLCDTVIRQHFEEVDQNAYLSQLSSGDVVFVDNSHRSFQSSDVTVFFTEVLPQLPPGVVYGIHDIFIPFDYPENWLSRFYNEQYLLVAYLLGGAGGDEVMFPCAYLSTNAVFSRAIREIFDQPYFAKVARSGGAFWMSRTGS